MLEIRKIPCPADKISLKCPFEMKPECIVIHNTANDATAAQEIAYMHSNNNEVSFHFAVDDREAVQGIELDRNAWHAGDGNGKGNRKGIGIEICYSLTGGERFEKAQENAAMLTAGLLKQFGLGLTAVTKHEDYSGKRCPHRTLEQYGWEYFLNRVRAHYSTELPSVIYAAFTDRWWEDVTNYEEKTNEGFAGIKGRAMTGFRARLTNGSIIYRAHLKGGKYLAWVRDLDKKQGGYAGIYGKEIDGIQMYIEGIEGAAVEYRVSTVGGIYLPWVRNYGSGADGYAGIYSKPIDRLQIRIVSA